MALYDYRCQSCGVVEVRLGMGAAKSSLACPTCGQAAQRLYSAPLLNRTPQTLASARNREERSAHEPEVVQRLPRRAPRPQPALQPLPRQ